MWAVLDYTNTRCIQRELLLVKVSILGPEYLEDQLVGGPSHDPRHSLGHVAPSPTLPEETSDGVPEGDRSPSFEQEVALAEQFEHSAEAPFRSTSAGGLAPAPLTASEALRIKHQYLHSISVLANQFSAKIVDVSDNSVIVEMSGKTNRVEAFLSLVKPFGIIESARTGIGFCMLVLMRLADLFVSSRYNGDDAHPAHFAAERRVGDDGCRWRRFEHAAPWMKVR